MQITRQADYALRTVLYLAGLEDGGRAPTGRIAREQRVPPSFLAKIVSQLAIAGLVQTARGARGGVSLARPAGEISVLEVIQAVDGPIRLFECLDDPAGCVFGEACPMRETLCNVQERLIRELSTADFRQLAARQRELARQVLSLAPSSSKS